MTPLIEMLQLPNFGRMNTSTVWFKSCDKFFWWRHKLYFKIPLKYRSSVSIDNFEHVIAGWEASFF